MDSSAKIATSWTIPVGKAEADPALPVMENQSHATCKHDAVMLLQSQINLAEMGDMKEIKEKNEKCDFNMNLITSSSSGAEALGQSCREWRSKNESEDLTDKLTDNSLLQDIKQACQSVEVCAVNDGISEERLTSAGDVDIKEYLFRKMRNESVSPSQLSKDDKADDEVKIQDRHLLIDNRTYIICKGNKNSPEPVKSNKVVKANPRTSSLTGRAVYRANKTFLRRARNTSCERVKEASVRSKSMESVHENVNKEKTAETSNRRASDVTSMSVSTQKSKMVVDSVDKELEEVNVNDTLDAASSSSSSSAGKQHVRSDEQIIQSTIYEVLKILSVFHHISDETLFVTEFPDLPVEEIVELKEFRKNVQLVYLFDPECKVKLEKAVQCLRSVMDDQDQAGGDGNGASRLKRNVDKLLSFHFCESSQPDTRTSAVLESSSDMNGNCPTGADKLLQSKNENGAVDGMIEKGPGSGGVRGGRANIGGYRGGERGGLKGEKSSSLSRKENSEDLMINVSTLSILITP